MRSIISGVLAAHIGGPPRRKLNARGGTIRGRCER
jgi:hypothetical protein